MLSSSCSRTAARRIQRAIRSGLAWCRKTGHAPTTSGTRCGATARAWSAQRQYGGVLARARVRRGETSGGRAWPASCRGRSRWKTCVRRSKNSRPAMRRAACGRDSRWCPTSRARCRAFGDARRRASASTETLLQYREAARAARSPSFRGGQRGRRSTSSWRRDSGLGAAAGRAACPRSWRRSSGRRCRATRILAAIPRLERRLG